LAGNLCYTLTVGTPDDSAAFQERRYRVFGIAAAHKVVVNIERELDREHRSRRLRVWWRRSNRLRVLLLGTLPLLVLRTLGRCGRAHRVGEPVIEQSWCRASRDSRCESATKNSGRLYAFGKTRSFFIIVTRKNPKQVRFEEKGRVFIIQKFDRMRTNRMEKFRLQQIV